MRFKDLSISRKLSVGFGSVLLLSVLSSGLAFIKINALAEIDRINSVSDDAQDQSDLLALDLAEARAATRKFVLTGAPADKEGAQAALQRQARHFAGLEKLLAADGPQFIADLHTYRDAVAAYVADTLEPELRLASDPATRPQAVAMVSNTNQVLSTAADRALKVLRERIAPWSDTWTEAAKQTMAELRMILVIMTVASLVIGVLAAWLVARAIGRPLTAMTSAMDRLAQGDTGVGIPAVGQRDEVGAMAQAVQVFKDNAIAKVAIEAESERSREAASAERARIAAQEAERSAQQATVVQGLAAGLAQLAAGNLVQRLGTPFAREYESLRADFNAAMDKLQGALSEVAAKTGAIRAGTGEISSASDDLSRRTEQQAASLEETAAALDQITATVRKTAEGSGEARTAVEAAQRDAETSSQVVTRAVDAMGAIQGSSQQIGQIIGVIDEIAFQTNLLALNAGVEAARAGDAGRGFAVVASEVRALAQRSATAAKEIKALIVASDGHVKAGVTLVGETGRALGRIVEQVVAINAIVVEIAASSQEQASGLAQVNVAVNQMDQVTQQNAAMVEQSTAAAKGLQQETAELSRLVARFTVGAAAPSEAAPNTVPSTRRPPARKAVAAAAATAEKWEEF